MKTAPAAVYSLRQCMFLERPPRRPNARQRTVGHGEGGGSGTVLGSDDLVSTELNALDEGSELLATGLNDLLALGGLGKDRDDGDTGVSSEAAEAAQMSSECDECRLEATAYTGTSVSLGEVPAKIGRAHV